jgi:hypothetical protein
MDFTGSAWQYRCSGHMWRSNDSDFDYSTDLLTFMERLHRGGEERIVSDPDYTYSATEETEAFTDIFCPGFIRMDTDQMLLLIPYGFEYTPKETVKWVSAGKLSCLDVDYDFDYLWADHDQAVLTLNGTEEPRTLVVIGNQNGLLVSVPPGSIAGVTDVEDAPSFLLKGQDGQDVLFAGVLPVAGNDETEFLVISGAFDEDEVFAVLNQNSFYITGLRDVTATIEKRSGEKTGSVHSFGGEMLIGGDFASGVMLTLLGDSDGDGKVTSSDARNVLRCSVKLESLDNYDALACDFDLDGSVTSADARLILRRSVGLRD